MASSRTHGFFPRLGIRWTHVVQRGIRTVRDEGVAGFFSKAAAWGRRTLRPHHYTRWVKAYDTLDDTARRQIVANVAELPSRPLISLLMPTFDDRDALRITLSSLRAQLYPQWQLVLGICESAKERLRPELQAMIEPNGRVCLVTVDREEAWSAKANHVLASATGEFIAILESGDVLPEHGLYWVAREALAHPNAKLIFSDEDAIRGNGVRSDPWFKPDWNPALMLSCNAVGRLAAFSRALVERLGGFREGFEGAEEYELALRCARATGDDRIRHIHRVLYHRRACARGRDTKARPDGDKSGRRAVSEHLAAQGIAGTVRRARGGHQVVYAASNQGQRVSVIVATTARPEIASRCFASLTGCTNYDDLEVIVLVQDADLKRPERAGFLKTIVDKKLFRIIEYSSRPFNYSSVNNLGAREASGDIFCFLNDDTETIAADWLQQLVSRVSLPGVAAVGPMLYYSDGTIQHAGVILGLAGVAGHACCHEPRGSIGYFGRACREQDVSCVTAACMAIRANVFRGVGGFDEELPLAYNDVDLCLRIRASEWRIIWTPEVELFHHESASLGRHDSRPHADQFARDVALMRERWGAVLAADPFYNLNLSLDRTHRLAFPPRHTVSTCDVSSIPKLQDC